MEIFNVLIKGIEVKDVNYCKAFLREDVMDTWIEEICRIRNWTIKSRIGWIEDNKLDDRRVEDLNGNTYYFVIYRQELV